MVIEEVIGDLPCIRDERKKVWRLRKQPYVNVYIALKYNMLMSNGTKVNVIVFGGTIHNIDFDLFIIPYDTIYRRRYNIDIFLEKSLIEINHLSEGGEDETLM